ncbi:NADH:flavin oxidoreductase/NADH oxidase [Sinosporangium siamense]|uniref:Oxidoreductase n=1 Tax=Sinosporangium siamense TaxID=1367973 RepID=A0A919RDP3_9ACTN|nr:NADH:flavin oxidoreductase/NADH oxidase [Sinosporangium siamense]GII92005.1 oxidoreductase [Sinosporangium siamense]
MLFSPLTLRSLTIANRVWMAPMCQYAAISDGPEAGVPLEWHYNHLATRAVGGAGLILTEATAVSPEGRISPFDLGLWNDRQEAAFARINEFLSQQGTVPGVQLAHAGRKAATDKTWRGGAPLPAAEGGWTTVAPSPIAFDSAHPTPAELSRDDIDGVVADFAQAAVRAVRAGFQVAEVHGAHGYLIHQFLSPHSNRRTDAYGGTFANRIRFALEVVEAVRAVWPDHLPVFFRVSATDWLPEGEGWTLEETVRLAKELLAHGVDLLDVSTGGNVADVKIPNGPGYQVPFAARVRAETDLPTSAVGEITDPHQAEDVIASGHADAVLLGRELLRNPYWPHEAARALGAEVRRPDPYHRAY